MYDHENTDIHRCPKLIYLIISGPNRDDMERLAKANDACARFHLVLGHFYEPNAQFPKKIYRDTQRPFPISIQSLSCVREGITTDGYFITGEIAEIRRYRCLIKDDALWQFEPTMQIGMPIYLSYGATQACGSCLLYTEQTRPDLDFPVKAGRAVTSIHESVRHSYYEVR